MLIPVHPDTGSNLELIKMCERLCWLWARHLLLSLVHFCQCFMMQMTPSGVVYHLLCKRRDSLKKTFLTSLVLLQFFFYLPPQWWKHSFWGHWNRDLIRAPTLMPEIMRLLHPNSPAMLAVANEERCCFTFYYLLRMEKNSTIND